MNGYSSGNTDSERKQSCLSVELVPNLGVLKAHIVAVLQYPRSIAHMFGRSDLIARHIIRQSFYIDLENTPLATSSLEIGLIETDIQLGKAHRQARPESTGERWLTRSKLQKIFEHKTFCFKQNTHVNGMTEQNGKILRITRNQRLRYLLIVATTAYCSTLELIQHKTSQIISACATCGAPSQHKASQSYSRSIFDRF